ncbi:MAG: hypothetical protein AAF322_19910, partial [Pseudomonadota bacterium]
VAWADFQNLDGLSGDVEPVDDQTEIQADLDIFVRNTATGAIQRASVNAEGGKLLTSDGLGATSTSAALSADGRFVVYATDGVGAANDLNDTGDIYIRDLFLDTAPEVVSVGANGLAAGQVFTPNDTGGTDSVGVIDVSADGTRVVFVTNADLTGTDKQDFNGFNDAYLRDLSTGETILISEGGGASEGQALGVAPLYIDFGDIVSITEDGRYVAFISGGAFTADDFDRQVDVFLEDTATGETLRLTPETPGFNVEGFALAADGSRIAYSTQAGVQPDDVNGLTDVYVADIDLAGFSVSNHRRVSETVDGFEIRGDDSGAPIISPDGSRVGFVSAAEDVFFFDPNTPFFDDNLGDRLYVRDLDAGTLEISELPIPDQASFETANAVLTDDGLVYRRAIDAAEGGSRDVSDTIAVGGTAPLPQIEVPGPGAAAAVELSRVSTIRSAIDSPSDVDVFQFSGTSARHEVTISGADGDGGTLADPFVAIRLGSPSGPQIRFDDDGGFGRDAFVSFDGASGQDYFIIVSSADGSTGSYRLEVDTIF